MDIFIECMVKHKKETKDKLILAAIIAAGILLSLILFVLAALFRLFSIGFVLIAGVWYGAVILMRTRTVEYEYILTNNELDVDKIIARNGRKRLVTLDFKEIMICASTEDPIHRHEYEAAANIEKTFDCTGDKEKGGVYFIDFHMNEQRCRLLFQPLDKMLREVKKYNPRNIFILEGNL